MKKVSVIIFFSAIALLTGCYKEKTFDLKPNISFKDIRKEIVLDQFSGSTKDSVIISIGFEDGDGDLGMNDKEVAIAQKTDNYNYLIRSFRKQKGVFVEYFPSPPYSAYFLRLKNGDKIGPIEGTLDRSIDFLAPFTPVKDSVKFQITIKDRAGNLSNTVESKVIILNEF